MKFLVDSNVFVAIAVAAHPHHQRALDWLHDLAHDDLLHFCRPTQNTFLRLLTTKAMMGAYVCSNNQAIELYRAIRSDSRVAFLSSEPVGLEKYWFEYAQHRQQAPRKWMDAYLAAWARAARMRFVTFDQGFDSFDHLDLQRLN